MNCRKFSELLSSYTDNELPDSTVADIEKHLAVCSQCKAVLSKFIIVNRQLSSLRDVPQMADINKATMLRIKDHTSKKLKHVSWRFLIPAVAILGIIMLICQLWFVPNNNRNILANALAASETIKSYRVTRTPGVMVIDASNSIDNTNNSMHEEYVLPDKAHIQFVINNINNEYIFIGNNLYYSTKNNLTFNFPYIPGYPEFTNDATTNLMYQTLNELQNNTDLKTLPDEVIDGVLCFHYMGSEKTNPFITEVWIGKSDHIARQIIKRKEPQGSKLKDESPVSITKFYDFNADITIHAPLSSTGEILPGWNVVDLKP